MNAKLFFGLFAGSAMALAMTGCSSDEPGGVQNDKAEKTVYLRVAISDVNAASRAANTTENFLDGTTAESAIGALQFRFFDAAGNAIDDVSETKYDFTELKEGDAEWPSVDRVKTAVVQVNLAQGQALPAYVLVFANPVSWDGAAAGTTMNGYRDIERSGYLDGAKHFAMSNSVYYGTDAVSGQANVKISGTPIQNGQLFATYAEAEKATGGDVVDIYIERRAARVDVKFTNEDGDGAATINTVAKGGYNLTFVPSAWTVTADAPTMYAIKRFATTAATDAKIPSMAEVDTYLGAGWGNTYWNDANLHRSYWACSPSFYATDFPRVSDNIVDKATAGTTGAGAVVAPYALKYYSFNQVNEVNGANGSPIANNNTAVTRYALENTMGTDAFQSVNPNAAAPSVLLTGRYTLTNQNGTALAANTSFAIWNNEIYFIGTVPEEANPGAQTILEAMLADQQIVATDANGTLLSTTRPGVGIAVQHPDATVRAENAVSEESMTLQLTTLPQEGNMLYYKPVGSEAWEPITTAPQMLYVNRQLAGQLNYAKAYTEGAAYFGIPIKHLRATEDAHTAKGTPFNANGTVADWKKVLVGDFGLVRNHVYTININGITGLGDGVLDLDYPIITPMDSYDYYIKYSIKVLNWRIVKAQNVIL